MKWHTEKRRVCDLVPMENNPRTMTDKQDKDLEKSIKKFDLVEIPVINIDNLLIAGHQRVRKLLAAGRGEEEIDVRVPDRKLSFKEIEEYNIRSNKNTGSWDFDKLANGFEVSDLIDWGFEEWEFGISEDKSDNDTNDDIQDQKSECNEAKCPKCGYKFKTNE